MTFAVECGSGGIGAVAMRASCGRLCRSHGLTRQTCPGLPLVGADFPERFDLMSGQRSCSTTILTREVS